MGPATFRQLINRYGSAEAAIEMLPELALSGGSLRPVRIPAEGEISAELDLATKCGARFVAIGEADYPPMLRQTDQPPPIVAIRGDAAVFSLPAVSIVGARNASLAGVKIARQFAADLGKSGYAIVSGLARGVDTAAHHGGLSTGTIAVLAGGIDRPYPPENRDLSEQIAGSGGALISEMPMGWEPRAQDFPRRNRLIAGLSLGLVVVEAALRSGSLISARMANDMGKVVFAVPGSPLDPRAAGANGLLKEGATIATEASDIEQHLAPLIGAAAPLQGALFEPEEIASAPPPADDDRARVVEALGPTPSHIDEIIRHTGVSTAQVFLILLELDLAGRLERHSGGSVSLVYA